MELEALRVLTIVIGVIMALFLLLGVIALVLAVRLMRKLSAQLDKTGLIADNVVGFTAGMSRLGAPLMAARLLFGIARKAFK